ncbi:MAG: lipoate--protein ligase [Bacteroidales bacterium]|nr:lipoate--protein ligase [Bacteroidales bacterium]
MRLRIVLNDGWDPYWNLAIENHLLECVVPNEVTLMLWHNRRTVVIGRNQNPYSECDVEAIGADGGYVSRRTTGGGAVYHDEGNLNFSFVAPHDLYDLTKQFDVIARAVATFGLNAERSGRNDMLVYVGEGGESGEGRKFSGNAFSKNKQAALHHGTILVQGDQTAMQRYLKPNPAKLMRHGVASVRSRVVNLAELADVNLHNITERLIAAAQEVYGTTATIVPADTLKDNPNVVRWHDLLESDEWLYGPWRNFNAQYKGCWDWGCAEIELTVDSATGTISKARIASDSLLPDIIEETERSLVGVKPGKTEALEGLREGGVEGSIMRDLLQLITA